MTEQLIAVSKNFILFLIWPACLFLQASASEHLLPEELETRQVVSDCMARLPAGHQCLWTSGKKSSPCDTNQMSVGKYSYTLCYKKKSNEDGEFYIKQYLRFQIADQYETYYDKHSAAQEHLTSSQEKKEIQARLKRALFRATQYYKKIGINYFIDYDFKTDRPKQRIDHSIQLWPAYVRATQNNWAILAGDWPTSTINEEFLGAVTAHELGHSLGESDSYADPEGCKIRKPGTRLNSMMNRGSNGKPNEMFIDQDEAMGILLPFCAEWRKI